MLLLVFTCIFCSFLGLSFLLCFFFSCALLLAFGLVCVCFSLLLGFCFSSQSFALSVCCVLRASMKVPASSSSSSVSVRDHFLVCLLFLMLFSLLFVFNLFPLLYLSLSLGKKDSSLSLREHLASRLGVCCFVSQGGTSGPSLLPSQLPCNSRILLLFSKAKQTTNNKQANTHTHAQNGTTVPAGERAGCRNDLQHMV